MNLLGQTNNQFLHINKLLPSNPSHTQHNQKKTLHKQKDIKPSTTPTSSLRTKHPSLQIHGERKREENSRSRGRRRRGGAASEVAAGQGGGRSG